MRATRSDVAVPNNGALRAAVPVRNRERVRNEEVAESQWSCVEGGQFVACSCSRTLIQLARTLQGRAQVPF